MNSSLEIKYDYPSSGNFEIDSQMRLEIKEQVSEFLMMSFFEESPIFRLELSYEKKEYQDFITYLLYRVLDTGGAHPNTTITTVTFKAGKRQEIEDFFTLEELTKISKLVQEELLSKKGAVKDMIEIGTLPSYANYRNFYFTETGIVFVFEPYQVAPYSAGTVEVLLPYSKVDMAS